MFMRLYFRIIFFTSYYCLSSFIINYLGYLVFLSCSSYVPKLKVGSMGWHHSDSTEAESPSPPRNTMKSSILVPWIRLGDILRVGFCHGCDFKQNADIWPDSPPPPDKNSVVLFWRNEKPPHWDGICDSVSCPVHTSVLADQTELLFSSSTGSGLKMACLHNIHVPSTIVKQYALVVLYHVYLWCEIGTSFTRRIM